METILLILCFLTTVNPLSIHKECFVQSGRETEFVWTGSHIDVTAWIAEAEQQIITNHNERQQSTPVLSFTLKYSNAIVDNDYDKIDIFSSRVNVTRFRNNELSEKPENISTQIKPGWTDFNFTAEGEFEIWHKHSSTKLASLSKEKEVKKIFVVGSNVTINCHLPYIAWAITKGERKTIPLYQEEQLHQFSFFSNERIKPIIMFGNQSLQVGWDGHNLVDITTTKTEYQKSLPSPAQHWFTLSCNEIEHSCTVKGKQELKTFAFSMNDSLPTSMSVTADDTAFVYFHRPSLPTPSSAMESHILANEKGTDTGSAGHVVAIIILTILCVGLAAGVAFFVRREIGSKQNENIEDQIRKVVKKEVTPLLGSNNNSNCSSIGYENQLETRVWNAVVENDARYIEFLLERGWNPNDPEKGRPTTPFIEAHFLGHNDILQVIAHSQNEERAIPPNDLIVKVMHELTQRMKKIFKSAVYGMYKQEQGVKLLLLSQSVPGTIRDHEGRSLLHYMASKSFMDGRPAWEAQDIEDFLRNHECYINAIDHWGNTALHSLAKRRREEEEKRVFWNDKEQTLSEAWLALTELLLSYGCDPRIPNHQDLLPHQLATDRGNHDMAKLLMRKCDVLGQVDLQKSMTDFKKIVTAAQQGDTRQLKNLLLEHVPLLPMCAQSDPLVEAIRHRQRDAVFLLLSAGSPLCNSSIQDLTPLETAHSTLGVPACFPALMRKAYIDRLASEISHVSESDESLKSLRLGMQQFMKQIEEKGSKSRWEFTETDQIKRSKEARRLLVKAAELGLSLTCQLLGLEDVLLHPFPGEQKPFEIALKNNHIDTQYVLYRDLKMSPHTSPLSLKVKSPRIAQHRWVSALMLLEEICSKNKFPELCGETGSPVVQYIQMLKEHEGICKGELKDNSLQDPPFLLLYMLSRYGLDTILHTLLRACKNLSVNSIIKPFSNSTLIHVSTMYGQLNMVEFLIYNGANLNLKTIGKFSPAHLAALKGHKECMHYILTYMESQGKDINEKCNLGYTAHELIDKYEKFCNKTFSPLLTHLNALHIKNRKRMSGQAYELLKKKSELMKISDAESLQKCATEKNRQIEDTEQIKKNVNEMTENICKQIDDPRFQGEIKQVGDLYEGNDIFNITKSCVIYELSKFHALKSSATVICKDVVNENNETSVKIQCDQHQDLFNGVKFRETFCNIIEKIAAKDGELVPGIYMIPPFVTTFSKGVTIYSVWTKRNEIRFMRTKIVPCLRAEIPPDSRLQTLPHNFNNFLKEECVHLLLKNIKGEWIYRAFNSENSIWSNLNENQKTVWLSCRLILVLLKKVWWSPLFNNKRYEKPWHTMSLGVAQPEDRAIKALFLEEMAECENWNKSDLFDRIYATFERAAKRDDHGKWVPKKTVNSFLTPRHYSSSIAESIVGIMNFLDDIRNVQTLTPEVQQRKEEKDFSKVTFHNI